MNKVTNKAGTNQAVGHSDNFTEINSNAQIRAKAAQTDNHRDRQRGNVVPANLCVVTDREMGTICQ